jgi:hypothetical protein
VGTVRMSVAFGLPMLDQSNSSIHSICFLVFSMKMDSLIHHKVMLHFNSLEQLL